MAKSKKHSASSSSAPKSQFPARPVADRVVIRPLPNEIKTPGGIIIPDTAGEKKPERGTVVAVGPGRFDECGENRIPMEVAVGDKVFFKKPWDEPIKVDGVEYYVVSESDITLIQK